MLATHPAIATTAEPWVLLPFMAARDPVGTWTRYRHEDAVLAIDDFLASFDEGEAAYQSVVREGVERLYASASPQGTLWFLDKTPRYHLYADSIMETFPEARAIFLWRHPLEVAASMIETWGQSWNLYRYTVDLREGLSALITASKKHAARSVQLRYEDVVADPVGSTGRVFSTLGLDADEARVLEFRTTKLPGRMGDPGREGRRPIEPRPDRWPEVFASPMRVLWARRYLDWLGDERMHYLGYPPKPPRVQRIGLRTILADSPRMAYGVAYRAFERLVEYRNRTYLVRMGQAHWARGSKSR